MSDILIRGMEMPKKNHRVLIEIDSNGNIYQPAYLYGRETPSKYKAVPVPPHGRLGDLDALIEKCEEMADKEDGNQLDALVLLKWFLEQNAPIVIPASEEGEI